MPQIAGMNVSEHTGNSEEGDAAAFYGYEEHIPSPNPPPKFTLQRERHAMMPRVPDSTLVSEEFGDFPPMSPDRAARKQRSISRRGGACYASLLQSAVQASMSSLGSSEDLEAMVPNFQEGPTSPRKRVRRTGLKEDDAAIAQTSTLLGNLYVDQFDEEEKDSPEPEAAEAPPSIDRKPPVRRVSRRTSYDSRATDGADSDLDSLDLDD